MRLGLAVAVLCVSTAPASWAQECNPRAFAVCSACHSLKAGEKKLGPNLAGIVGRKFASDSDFTTYSPALKAAGAKGEVWSKEKLDAFLADPQAAYPGTTMSATSIRNAKQRTDILCVLQSP